MNSDCVSGSSVTKFGLDVDFSSSSSSSAASSSSIPHRSRFLTLIQNQQNRISSLLQLYLIIVCTLTWVSVISLLILKAVRDHKNTGDSSNESGTSSGSCGSASCAPSSPSTQLEPNQTEIHLDDSIPPSSLTHLNLLDNSDTATAMLQLIWALSVLVATCAVKRRRKLQLELAREQLEDGELDWLSSNSIVKAEGLYVSLQNQTLCQLDSRRSDVELLPSSNKRCSFSLSADPSQPIHSSTSLPDADVDASLLPFTSAASPPMFSTNSRLRLHPRIYSSAQSCYQLLIIFFLCWIVPFTAGLFQYLSGVAIGSYGWYNQQFAVRVTHNLGLSYSTDDGEFMPAPSATNSSSTDTLSPSPSAVPLSWLYTCLFGWLWDLFPPSSADWGSGMSFQGACWMILALIEEIGWSGILWPYLLEYNTWKEWNKRQTVQKDDAKNDLEEQQEVAPLEQQADQTKARDRQQHRESQKEEDSVSAKEHNSLNQIDTKTTPKRHPPASSSAAELDFALLRSSSFSSSFDMALAPFSSSSRLPSNFSSSFSSSHFQLPPSFSILLRSTFVCAVIWCSWHWLFVLLGGWGLLPDAAVYHAGTMSTPLVYAFFVFSFTTICARFILCYLLIVTQTIWSCVIFHAVHNSLIYSFFTQLPKFQTVMNADGIEGGVLTHTSADYMIGESGIGVALVYAIAAGIVIYRWRREAEQRVKQHLNSNKMFGKSATK